MRERDPFEKGIKTSPTGRVPQWVVDEALGRPVEPVPFRGATAGPAARPQRRKRPRLRVVLTAASVIAVCAAVVAVDPAVLHTGPRVQADTPRSLDTTMPPLAHDERPRRLLPAPAVTAMPEGRGYRFLTHQHASTAPVTWSPCRPVHYVVRPDNQPAAGRAVLDAAFAAMSAATGLRFVNDGPTSEKPTEDRESFQPDRYGKRWAPVLVTWATADEVPDFGIDVLGEAGPVAMGTPSGDGTYVSGGMALDAVKMSKLASSPRGVAVATQVVMHELGHLVGLAHVNDRSDIMFPQASSTVMTFGAGDLAGLARLGTGSCQRDI